MGWPTPKNVSKARFFMGVVGYYRRFMGFFSKVAHPITSLRRKESSFSGHHNVKKFSRN